MLAIFFCPENDVCLLQPLITSAAYIQVHFRLDFIVEANNMNLYNLTAPKIWVHVVCNIDKLRASEDKLADDKCRDWWENKNP